MQPIQLPAICLLLLYLAPAFLTSCRRDDDRAKEADHAAQRVRVPRGPVEERPWPEIPPGLLPPVSAPGPDAPKQLRTPQAAIRAAMLSVAFHARRDGLVRLPPQLQPIPLEQAARILRADAERSPFAESRRRRAIRKLVVGGLELSSERTHSHRYGQALDILGAPLDEIDVLIRDRLAELPLDLDLANLLVLLLENLGLQLFELLNAGGPPIPGCNVVSPPQTEVHDDPSDAPSTCDYPDESWKTDLAWGTTTMEIESSIPELSKVMDPQNWDVNDCSAYFVSTYAVEWDEIEEEWVTVPCPPTPGMDWSGHLYEHFSLEFALSSSQFHVILEIESDREPDTDPHEYGIDYCLEKHIYSEVYSALFNDTGEVDVDDGYALATENEEGTIDLVVEKMVHFSGWSNDAAMNFWARVFIEQLGDALEETICCAPPAPVTCVAP